MGAGADADIPRQDQRLTVIRQNSQLGHGRSDLPATHLVGSHVLVYRVGTDSLGVVRILHQRMSLARHL